MLTITLKFTLLSEACFSRGDGIPGMVDIEVNHDANGLPYLGGRTLKGLLHVEASEIIDALKSADHDAYTKWFPVANYLFGQPGSVQADQAQMYIGNAQLPADLRSQVQHTLQQEAKGVEPHDVLETLTAIRRQTAVDSSTGAPLEDTLRSVRVILSETPFEATLILADDPLQTDGLAFLAACVKAWRHAGSNKTRGYGRLTADLFVNATIETDVHFGRFKESLLS